MQGQIIEVSKDKKIVWKLPAAASFLKDKNNSLSIEIFKARQY